MDLGISKRTALVLGAGGGLGRAIALTLAKEGAVVVVSDVEPASLQASADAIKAMGGRCLAIQWDISQLDLIDGHIANIERNLGGVDILFNNTGGPPPGIATGQDSALWKQYFDSMVLSVIKITDRVLPRMRQQKWGRIIISASSGVISPIPNLALSNALRSTLVGWSKSLAREVAADGITANIIVPGRIATDRIRFLDESKAKRENKSLDAVIAESTAAIPTGRYGTPAEYADMVAFLASERASYVTGSTLRVDGGYLSNI